ncbi:unnamed protein product [Pseudo-nitzschia multistriata]|uniref:BHLH domain-containing protein n=1 Tax=Pseudo-nitzschia multistriata TaxID=183589 RepID=A0A448ZCX8_9STRA|nr:unnamed protein product [Pseudo-nitzschia multistriata]
MDEFQFIESLDALLASEAMDEATTAAGVELANQSSNASMSLPMNTHLHSSTETAPLQGQGIFGMNCTLGGSNASCNWLGVNEANTSDNANSTKTSNNSNPNPFSMPMQSPTRMTMISEAPSIAPLHHFQNFASATGTAPTAINPYVEQIPSGATSLTSTNNTNSTIGTIDGDNTLKTGLGTILPSSTLTNPIISQPTTTAATSTNALPNADPSGVASICSANSRNSANSRGSSHASSSKRRGSNKGGGADKTSVSSRKRSRTTTAVSESEDDCSRRRQDRNLREQRRSQKITHQIDQLREVLAAASVRFKPDKYSTLVSVVEYVKQLQRRSTMLDQEHKKLLDTITRTNEMVNEPYLQNSGVSAASAIAGGGGNNPGMGNRAENAQPDSALSGGAGATNSSNSNAVSGGPNDIFNEDELVFVRNVDYKSIFDRCGMPLAVASIDGRLIDCNAEFVKMTGFERTDLLPAEQQQHRKQPSSAIIADDVGSSHLSGAVFPDAASSSSNGNDSSTGIEQDPKTQTSSAKASQNFLSL